MARSSATPKSPAPQRRSSRIKRRVEAAEAAALVAAAAPPPQKKLKTDLHQKTKPTSVPEVRPFHQVYSQSEHVLFLDDTFTNFFWTPPRVTHRRAINLPAHLATHDGDVHAYFKTKAAATHAASDLCPPAIYRHIGSVVLDDVVFHTESMECFKKSKEKYVSLGPAFPNCQAKNQDLADSLYSLTLTGTLPYDPPYLVVLAEREHVLALKKKGSPLTAQIYVGRLLFELIAYEDTKTVFQYLIPPHPIQPVAKMPEYPATMQRSPRPPDEEQNAYTLSGLLRRAESVGYTKLTDAQREKIKSSLTVQLYPFQEQTVRWMIDKENDPKSINDYFWQEYTFSPSTKNGRKDHFYYFPKAGELRLSKPPDIRGGMVTEEMGLGKTVEALALIAAQKKPFFSSDISIRLEKRPVGVSLDKNIIQVQKQRQQNQDNSKQEACPLHFGDEVLNPNNRQYPKTVRVRRGTPMSTLVLCPKSLIAQWKSEAERRAPSLTVVEWEIPSRDRDGTHWSAAVGEHAYDIVLATYEALQKDNTLSKISWKRLILDEAQVTRRSSTQVAKDTFNLRSESRFLMTGTPIVSSIDDLRGELAFLRVWPFTLFQDGFWESQINEPFALRQSTVLVDHMLSVTMMRHTKAQNLDLGLPPRSYETIEVELSNSHRAIYCFILGCCLEELDLWSTERTYPRQLRILLKILLSACISPSLIDLRALDLARRSIWSRRTVINRSSSGSNQNLVLKKMHPSEAIRFLAETASRIIRDSNRTHSTLHSACVNQFDQFLRMEREALQNIVETRGLLPENAGRVTHRRLAQLAAGGVHRLSGDTIAELRDTLVRLRVMSEPEAALVSRKRAMSKLQKHYATTAATPGRSIHEAGFAALTRLIEQKESPSCPVCLAGSMDRISLTKCGHFYCVDCLMLMFANSVQRAVKCAICRRDVRPEMAVEVLPAEDEVGAGPADAENSDRDASLPEPTRQLLTFVYRSDVNRYRNAPKPTTDEVWTEYKEIGGAPSHFGFIGRNPDLPSLDAEFLRHLGAASSESAVAPKLFALRSLIRSCGMDTKFCVVAETESSLKGICRWLNDQGIPATGVGSPEWSGSSKAVGSIAQQFATDPNLRVFLLNTANSAGLTLTAAQYVVLMEPMLRITDEMQAAARVHRIGQTRPVKIVRIISKNTVEEQIMFQRGEISTPGQETQALLSADGKETQTKDLFKLFRTSSDEWDSVL